MKKNSINIFCASGLCNRIRYLFSLIHKIQKEDNGRTLKIIWPINEACMNTFESCFEPIDNVEFIYKSQDDYKIDYNGEVSKHGFIANYSPKHIPNFYSKLQINSNIKNMLKQQNNNLEYNAIHIRRTDHCYLAKIHNQYTEDYAFEQFIINSSLPVYLSTDNKETQKNYTKKYKDIIVYQYIQEDNNRLRKTSLEHSVIDMWMCIQSKEFMPSGYSSFSDLIKDKRKELYA